jgi:hypothetical protein
MSKPTILLVPTDPSSPLLAPGRAGARAPVLTWCYSEITDVDGWAVPSPSMRPHENPVRRALVLALDGEPVPEGVDRVRRVLAIAEGCPFDPANVVLVDDLYRREHFWRLVAFRWSGHGRRWGKSYAGKPVRLADFEHVPGIVAGDGSGMALVRALATIAAHRLGCEVVVVGEANDGRP